MSSTIHLISIKYRFDEQLFVGTIERSIDHDDHWRTLYIRVYNNIIVAHIPGYYAMTGTLSDIANNRWM